MKKIAAELSALIDHHRSELLSIDPEKMQIKPAPGKWSKKEIIGHMIDSAESNIRRFIVSQYEDNPKIVYAQDTWVKASGYQQWNEEELVDLWYGLNRQLCQVLNNMPPGMAGRQCLTEALHTLEWLAADYVKHLKHHLHQVLDLEPIPYP